MAPSTTAAHTLVPALSLPNFELFDVTVRLVTNGEMQTNILPPSRWETCEGGGIKKKRGKESFHPLRTVGSRPSAVMSLLH